jgi:hypothetical protein
VASVAGSLDLEGRSNSGAIRLTQSFHHALRAMRTMRSALLPSPLKPRVCIAAANDETIDSYSAGKYVVTATPLGAFSLSHTLDPASLLELEAFTRYVQITSYVGALLRSGYVVE